MKMSPADLSENVIAAASQISAGVAGGAKNIKQLSIKSSLSLSIPIYMSEGGPQDVKFPRERRAKKVEAEEISTLLDAKVKVYPDGRIIVIKDGEKEAPPKRQKRKNVNQHKKQLRKKTQDVKPPQAKKFKKK
uniref:Uncharacterized protein n=2 Tax=Arion vulgaris TaxID=1028688 RepID=A0A0B6ZZG8_9EUPU